MVLVVVVVTCGGKVTASHHINCCILTAEQLSTTCESEQKTLAKHKLEWIQPRMTKYHISFIVQNSVNTQFTISVLWSSPSSPLIMELAGMVRGVSRLKILFLLLLVLSVTVTVLDFYSADFRYNKTGFKLYIYLNIGWCYRGSVPFPTQRMSLNKDR